MALKKYKPITAGRRGMSGYDFAEITTDSPLKSLTKGRSEKAGRNTTGIITMRRKGGGHKRRYREIDFKRTKDGIEAKVEQIEYDPNRTARIARICYLDGARAYIIAPNQLKVGDKVMSGAGAEIQVGNTLPLHAIPQGTLVHNLELKPEKGGQLVKSAGSSAQIMAKEGEYVSVRLPSGEVRKIHRNCRATIGQVGNSEHSNISLGKAGRSRWLGRRPKVRGVAMNPIDHPMGGGEGKTSGGRNPCSPWGKPTKGYRTRKPKKQSSKYIVRSRHAKK